MAMGSLFRELQAVLSVYLGIMVEGAVTGLSAVAIPAMLRCLLFPSLIGSCPSIGSRRLAQMRKMVRRRKSLGTS